MRGEVLLPAGNTSHDECLLVSTGRRFIVSVLLEENVSSELMGSGGSWGSGLLVRAMISSRQKSVFVGSGLLGSSSCLGFVLSGSGIFMLQSALGLGLFGSSSGTIDSGIVGLISIHGSAIGSGLFRYQLLLFISGERGAGSELLRPRFGLELVKSLQGLGLAKRRGGSGLIGGEKRWLKKRSAVDVHGENILGNLEVKPRLGGEPGEGGGDLGEVGGEGGMRGGEGQRGLGGLGGLRGLGGVITISSSLKSKFSGSL